MLKQYIAEFARQLLSPAMKNRNLCLASLGFALLCVGVFIQSCTSQGQTPSPTAHVSLVLPTTYPTETLTPHPTLTPLPTLSFTPLPRPTLLEPCISFYDRTNGDLKFTCLENRKWVVDTVDSEGDVGLYSSLAFDRFSTPYISYYSRSEQKLKIAIRKGNQWTTAVVDLGKGAGLFTSLAIRRDDTVFISYYDEERGYIKMAHLEKKQWIIDDVDFIGTNKDNLELDLFRTSLVLDANGYPVISYVDLVNRNLKMARQDASGQWRSVVVDDSPDVGWSNSLMINVGGFPVISYFDQNLQVLKLASLEPTGWSIQVLDDTVGTGAYTSIGLGEQGNYIVAYFDDNFDDMKLRIAEKTTSIKSRRNIGWYISLALDQNGNPLIAYYDFSQKDLGIVQFQNNRYQITTIATSGDVGLYPSIRFVPKYGTN
ncbi:MAG: hypothetical protein IH588_12575 [Anaerolineales bacterium]|nr:hypothetical protein [Anaerolineales bacterium]